MAAEIRPRPRRPVVHRGRFNEAAANGRGNHDTPVVECIKSLVSFNEAAANGRGNVRLGGRGSNQDFASMRPRRMAAEMCTEFLDIVPESSLQ